MRSPKQQFFLLLAVSLSLSCSQQKAFSSEGLHQVQLGSHSIIRNRSDFVEILCQSSSSILEMEEGKVDNSSQDTETGASGDSTQNSPPDLGTANEAGGELGLPEAQEHVEDQTSQSSERVSRGAVQGSEDAVKQDGRESSIQDDGMVEIRKSEQSKPQEVKSSDDDSSSKEQRKVSKKKLSVKKSKDKRALGKSEPEMPPVAPKITQPDVAKLPTSKPVTEEAMLGRLVRELEFGTLLNSIALLNQLVSKYPEDPDYNSLLAMAIRLRDGDVWYQYARKVDIKEDTTPKPQAPVQIMKPTSNETVNELKKSSWFLIRSAKR